MSELLHRAQEVKLLASDMSRSTSERLRHVVESLTVAHNVGGMDDDDWKDYLEEMTKTVSLLKGGDAPASAGSQQVSDEVMQESLDSLQAAAERTIESELDRMVQELDRSGRKLPVETIREVREHRDLMVPRLIRVLRDTADAARAGGLPKGNAHFLALFLLSEFQAREALPAILDVVSLPGKLPGELFGDAMTETLAGILAQFAGDTPDILDAIISNRELDEFMRWEGSQAYIHLVRDERLSRSEVVERLRQQLRRAIEQEDVEIIAPLIIDLADLAAIEASEEITEAFDRGLVEPGMIQMDDVRRAFDEGDARVESTLRLRPPSGIADTIEELSKWASYREESNKWPKSPDSTYPTAADIPAYMDGPLATTQLSQPARPRVGRNDACPCGSGKKFKKCCGRRG